MKKLKNPPMSHNARYDVYSHKSLFKCYTPYRLVDKYILRTNTSTFDVFVYQVGKLYFYRLIDDVTVSNSSCFTSLDDCLYSLRNFASIVNGKLRIFI